MALFTVTRYTGEPGENSSDEKSNDILHELHQQALQRKRESLPSVTGSISQTEKERKKGSDRKRRKSNRIADSDEGKSPSKITKLKHGENSLVKGKKIKPSKLAKVSFEVEKEKQKERSSSASEDEPSDADDAIHSGVSCEGFDENIVESETGAVLSEDEESEANKQVSGEQEQSIENGGEAFTVLGEAPRKKIKKVERVLPQWLAQPSVVKADIRHNTTPLTDIQGIGDDLIDRLKENGIQSYFPVQAQVIPALLEGSKTGFLTGRAGYRPSDICCSAPTGSGKTLAYVVPIIQALRTRVTCQIRALVVLPVSDLATQVFKVFQTYCEGTPLKVGSAVGLKTFNHEQHSLVRKVSLSSGEESYHSLVDILVATPGRLVDHINSTKGFSLKSLRFLVIDEADRMMDEIKQDWLGRVERGVFSEGRNAVGGRSMPGPLTAANMSKAQMPLQKLLFSATLSQNPEKLQQLGLFQPRLFTSVVQATTVQRTQKSKSTEEVNDTSMDLEESQDTSLNITSEAESSQLDNSISSKTGEFVGKYTTPAGLSEFYIACKVGSEKPLVMLHLLYHLKFKHVLCFTNSIETTHRLFLLVKQIGNLEVQEFSSRLHANKRNRMLKQFKAGKIDLLICSDAMARGMDIENVQYVISYESPPFLKTYIHRSGRTARAGKVGTAVTLLEKKEIFHFKKMIKEAGKAKIKEMKLEKSDLKPHAEPLEKALKQVSAIIQHEKREKKR